MILASVRETKALNEVIEWNDERSGRFDKNAKATDPQLESARRCCAYLPNENAKGATAEDKNVEVLTGK